MKVPRSFRSFAFVLTALTATLLLSHGSAQPNIDDGGNTMHADASARVWAK